MPPAVKKQPSSSRTGRGVATSCPVGPMVRLAVLAGSVPVMVCVA
jgi:hypothetical protein